jgi:hypothetical protein
MTFNQLKLLEGNKRMMYILERKPRFLSIDYNQIKTGRKTIVTKGPDWASTGN